MLLGPCLGTFCVFQRALFEPIAFKDLRGKSFPKRLEELFLNIYSMDYKVTLKDCLNKTKFFPFLIKNVGEKLLKTMMEN